ncbi:MAG: hypothetical protein HQL38_05415 [Alphaproteobacteria bacterium]|nr:hypothetical protein [Alphaproteobacteria bacterium]
MLDIDAHPIRIADVAAFHRLNGYGVADMLWLLCVTPNRWGTMMRDARLDPDTLAHQQHALLIRWLWAHPGVTPPLRGPHPSEMHRRLERIFGAVLPPALFGPLLGGSVNQARGWLSGRGTGPATRRAVALIDDADDRVLTANWTEWCEHARHEARLRGLDTFQRASRGAAAWTAPAMSGVA